MFHDLLDLLDRDRHRQRARRGRRGVLDRLRDRTRAVRRHRQYGGDLYVPIGQLVPVPVRLNPARRHHHRRRERLEWDA